MNQGEQTDGRPFVESIIIDKLAACDVDRVRVGCAVYVAVIERHTNCPSCIASVIGETTVLNDDRVVECNVEGVNTDSST